MKWSVSLLMLEVAAKVKKLCYHTMSTGMPKVLARQNNVTRDISVSESVSRCRHYTFSRANVRHGCQMAIANFLDCAC